MIQRLAREHAEETGAKKPKGKGNTHCVWLWSPWN